MIRRLLPKLHRPDVKGRRRPAGVGVDACLVLAVWWIITRSMVAHGVCVGLVLIGAAIFETRAEQVVSFRYLLTHLPVWGWGATLIVTSVAWLLARGVWCVVAAVATGVWFVAFATAFLLAWLTLDTSGTTVTGWVTYFFLGWAWLLVAYVVSKDLRYVRSETARLDRVHEELLAMHEELSPPPI